MSNKSNQQSVFKEKPLRRLPKARDPILEGQNLAEVGRLEEYRSDLQVKKAGKKVVEHTEHSPDPLVRI